MDYKFNRDRVVRAAVKGVLDTLPGVKAELTYSFDAEAVEVKPTRDVAKIVKALGTYEDEAIHFLDSTGEYVGWIRLVHDFWGNPGEIIADYTTNLEEGLKRSSEIADHIMDRWDALDD